ncbi:serine hydrolase [Sphingobium amiense]|uniref:Serine hydrolase n=1 Tax=Sphingobium amiense TaxID=135719 RepID=A0A494WB03_9SPHN|nr:serine hydrolase [Sphingobium amiense]BBD97930.1 serine hydrolase [Sphingobium amiense]
MKRVAGRLAFAALAFCLCLFQSGVVMAAPSPTYASRAAQLVHILGQPGGEEDFFSTLFLDAVPLDRWRAVAAELRAQHGRPVALGAVRTESDTTGQVEVRYERATVGFTLVVAPQAPGKVIGLHIVGVTTAGDGLDRVAADLRALPGRTGFAMARLTEAGPTWLPVSAGDTSMAVGSSYKLYILAELARAVAAGERRWSDVVPLGPKSFSGRLLGWPDGAPMTLHSLATAMTSESDNSASDTLMLALGRERVDAMVRATGHALPDRALPLLTSAEAFALKMPANADLLARWRAGPVEDRRALLRDEAARLAGDRVDIGSVAETPTAIDSAEWFASPRDMVAAMDWLRRHGGDALPVMAVNPGIAPADAKRWRYLGYKGGSEPGVLAMTFLAQRADGAWFAVSGAWNDDRARLDEGRFVAIMTRALNLLAAGAGDQADSASPKPTERNSGTGPFQPSSGPSSAASRR